MKHEPTGDYEVGYCRPPKNRQFGQPEGNPRRSGFWDMSATPRAKLEKMMTLTEDELKAVADDKSAPYFERKIARCINSGEWKQIEGMINQVYGQPKQTIKATGFFQDAQVTFNEVAPKDKKELESLKPEDKES